MLEGLFSIHVIIPFKCDPPSSHCTPPPLPPKKMLPSERERLNEADLPPNSYHHIIGAARKVSPN